uniref:Uncharacterized protein n=1 Tax=Anguilla anguilla TaxID=7936 RepID=A0A0E9XEB5_ANGAN
MKEEKNKHVYCSVMRDVKRKSVHSRKRKQRNFCLAMRGIQTTSLMCTL